MIESVVQMAATAVGGAVLTGGALFVVAGAIGWVGHHLSGEVHLPNGGVTYRPEPAPEPAPDAFEVFGIAQPGEIEGVRSGRYADGSAWVLRSDILAAQRLPRP